MKKIPYIILVFVLTTWACGHLDKKVEERKLYDNTSNLESSKTNDLVKQDTSNQYIYDFMKIVIADQKLDLTYGLTLEPEDRIDFSKSDSLFLESLLIQKSKPNSDTGDWRKNMTIVANPFELPKSLKKADIKAMLVQKENLKDFKWDNTRLGFNLSNKKNWYSFSKPLFSKDKKKVIMMIRDLCPGLCGTGWTVIFIKDDGKWVSHKGGQWIH